MRTFALMAVFAVAALADDHQPPSDEPVVPCGPPGTENECKLDVEDNGPENSAEVIIEIIEGILDAVIADE